MEKRLENDEEIRRMYKFACEKLESGDTKEALALVDQIVELVPESSRYWSAKGAFYYEIADYDTAEAAAKKSVELNRKNYFGWLTLAKCKVDQRQLKEAIQYYKKYVELKEFDWAYTMLADLETDFDPVSAIAHAERALALNPDYDDAQRVLEAAKAKVNEKKAD